MATDLSRMTPPPPVEPEGDSAARPKVYLPGLNGIRFIAASAVMIHHIEQGKGAAGLPSFYTEDHPLLLKAGGLGVTLFFVLSGFLISYLLLVELQSTGSVRIFNFYVRRILRIWPLYYFIVLLAWVVLPNLKLFQTLGFQDPFGPDYVPRIAFFLLFCPQWVPPRFFTSTLAGPLWSVGVEEHFYAFWPLLVRAFKGRILWPCLAVLVLFVVLRADIRYGQRLWKEGEAAELLAYLKNVLYMTRFGCMAIGGIAAWLCLKAQDRIQWLFRRDVQAITIAALAGFLASGVSIRLLEHEFYSVFFAILILNVSLNPKSLLRLENPLLRFLGEISYGLYVYHWFAIVVVMSALRGMGGVEAPALRNVLIYSSVAALTTAVAAISYRLLERPFLRKKESFAIVLSGSAARPSADRLSLATPSDKLDPR